MAHRETHGAIGQSQTALGSMIGGYLGLQAAVRGVETLARVWADVEKRTEAAAAAALKYQADTRELATLRGYQQPEQAVPGALKFSLRTRLDAQAADDFRRQYEGSLPAGMQKGNIDRDTADKLAEQAGIMAARQGGSAATRGDLAGILGQFKKFSPGEQGVTEALGQLEAVRIGLTEGRGDDTPLTKSLLHVAGSMVKEKGGPIATLPEMAALVGVTSLSAGPLMADTRAEQLMRGLRGTTPEQIERLKGEFDIKELDNLETRLDKMIPKLRAVAAAGRDPTTYLIQEKIANEEQARALIEVEPNYEILKQRMAMARGADQGETVRQQNAAFLTGPLGTSMLAKNRAQAAEVAVGTKFVDAKNAFDLERASQDAREKNLSPLTYYGDVLEGLMGGAILSPAEAGKEKRVQYGALGKLRAEAVRLGVSAEEYAGAVGGFGSGQTPAEEAQAISGLIRQKGGDPSRAYREDPQLTKLIALMERQNALMEAQQKAAAVTATPPGPLPGAPRVINRQ